MSIHRSGLGRLRKNFTAVLDGQLAELVLLAHDAATEPDLLDPLEDLLARVHATAASLDLPELAEAARKAQEACHSGDIVDKVNRLMHARETMDGSTPAFRPVLVLTHSGRIEHLQDRAMSCSVQIDVFTEVHEVLPSAQGLRPFAVVCPLTVLDELLDDLRSDSSLATVPVFAELPFGLPPEQELEARQLATRLGATGHLEGPIDIPGMLWRIREHTPATDEGPYRVLAVGDAAQQRLASLANGELSVHGHPGPEQLLTALDRHDPELLVVSESFPPELLALLRAHERHHSLAVLFLHQVGQDEGSSAFFGSHEDRLQEDTPDTAMKALILGRLRRLRHGYRVSQLDRVTGMSSRNTLLAIADREVGMSRRSGEPMSAALLRLEGLDELEQRKGRGARDLALRRCARLLQAHFRETDAVGRVGEDTLMLVLPSCSAEHATERLELARARFLAMEGTRQDGGSLARAGFTAGIADTARAASNVLHRAEVALHRVKDPGGIER